MVPERNLGIFLPDINSMLSARRGRARREVLQDDSQLTCLAEIDPLGVVLEALP